MKITVEFNSLEEMDQFCNGVAIAPKFAGGTDVAAAEEKQEAPVKKKNRSVKEAAAEPQPEPPVTEEAAEEKVPAEETTYTLEDVRAKLGALQKAGHRDEVKKMLQSVGAEKLPEVDPKDYGLLMQKAGELDA